MTGKAGLVTFAIARSILEMVNIQLREELATSG
jgi:hypothetical protein